MAGCVRPAGARGGQRRLRLRAARGPAGPARGPGREGQGRRHLPAPRLHPDQGDPARGRGGRRRPGRGAVRRSTRRSTRSTWPAVTAYADERGRPALQGSVRAGRRARHQRGRRRGPAGRRSTGGPAIAVGDERLPARRTSCWPPARRPHASPGWTIDGEHILTSEHALRLDRLPASAVVLGGGVIGCEFASAWRSFGVEVTDRRGAAPAAGRRGAGRSPPRSNARSASAGSPWSPAHRSRVGRPPSRRAYG